MEHFLMQQASVRKDVRVTRSSTLRPEVNPRCKLNDRPVQKLDCIDKGDLANEKAEGLRTA